MFGELKLGGIERSVRLDESVLLAHDDLRRHRLAIEFGQHRLVIEQIKLAGGAAHEKIDHAVGLRLEVRLLWRQRIGDLRYRRAQCVVLPEE